MIDIGEVRTRFRAECEDVFSSDGFRYFNKREAYRHKVSSKIEHLAHFRIVKTTQVLIEPSFSIRQLEVERVFHEAMDTPKKFIDMTSVLWPHATTLVPNISEEILFHIDSKEAIIESARIFTNLYLDYAQKFFDSHSELNEINHVLDSAPLKPCAYQSSPFHRCGFGAIVAIILYGRNEAVGIIEAHRNVLKTIDNGFYLPKYDSLVDPSQDWWNPLSCPKCPQTKSG